MPRTVTIYQPYHIYSQAKKDRTVRCLPAAECLEVFFHLLHKDGYTNSWRIQQCLYMKPAKLRQSCTPLMPSSISIRINNINILKVVSSKLFYILSHSPPCTQINEKPTYLRVNSFSLKTSSGTKALHFLLCFTFKGKCCYRRFLAT